MPLSNNADDRRGVRNGRSKAAARTRRRASAPYLESLESRALLSTVQGPGPEALPAVAVGPRYVPGEVLVQYKAEAGEVERAKARGKSEAVLSERDPHQPHARRQAGRPGAGHRGGRALGRGDHPGAGGGPGRRIRRAELDLHDPGHLQRPVLYRAARSGACTATTHRSRPTRHSTGARRARRGRPATPAPRRSTSASSTRGSTINHPDLAANIWTNPCEIAGDGIDNDGNGYVDDVHGWDFFHNDGTVYDGGRGRPRDARRRHHRRPWAATASGLPGVAWDVKIISGKFLGPDGGDHGRRDQGDRLLRRPEDKRGLNIVALNNSWGGGGFSQALLDAIIRAAKAGHPVRRGGRQRRTGPAGRQQRRVPQLSVELHHRRLHHRRRGYDSVIAVAAIDSAGRLASFSNYGATTVDLGAPGVNINSTLPGGKYGAYSGTSMATPHVTGAIALYASSNPRPTAEAIRDKVLSTVAPTSSLSKKTVTGGRLDVGRLMAGLVDPADTPTAAGAPVTWPPRPRRPAPGQIDLDRRRAPMRRGSGSSVDRTA